MALILPKPLSALLEEPDTDPQWLIAPILPAQGITLLHGRFSLGKCFAPSTPVLMANGSIKQVGQITAGDQVMGPDSTPRTVLEVHSGSDQMYQVTPSMGAPWLANSQHIMGFIGRDGKWAEKPITQIPKGTNKSLKRVAVDFPTQPTPLPIDPYVIGALLGDGYMRNGVSLTTADPEMVWMLTQQAARWGLQVKRKGEFGYKLVRQRGAFYQKGVRSQGRPASVRNPLLSALDDIGLAGCVGKAKHIPTPYKLARQEHRRSLLAGLIDTDGYVNSSTVSFTLVAERLANDIAFVAGSLGYRVGAVTKVTKTCTNTGAKGQYFSVNFSVPAGLEPPSTVLARKHITPNERGGVGFKVEAAGFGEYAGFSVDGDECFLLADFTVVHNSPLTWKIAQSVSDGDDFFGLPVATTGNVLYIEVDTPERQVKPRLRLLEPIAERVFIANGYPRLNLMTHNSPEVIELVKAYHDIKPVLVIVNTLRKVHDYDQNLSESANLVYTELLKRFPNSAIMVVHHDKKQQAEGGSRDEQFSGSQSWANDATVALHLTSINKAENTLNLEVSKSQVSPTGSLLKLKLGDDGTNFIDNRSSQARKVFDGLPPEWAQGQKIKFVASQNKVHEKTVYRWLRQEKVALQKP